MTSSVVQQKLDNGRVDFGDAAVSGLAGATTAGALHGARVRLGGIATSENPRLFKVDSLGVATEAGRITNPSPWLAALEPVVKTVGRTTGREVNESRNDDDEDDDDD